MGTGHPPVLLSCTKLHQCSAVWGIRGVGSKPAYGLGASDKENRARAGSGAEVFQSRLFFQFIFGRETNLSVEDLSLSVLLLRTGLRAS